MSESPPADSVAERAALGRGVRRSTLLAATAANLIGATVVAIYLVVLSPGDLPDDFRLGEAIVLFAVYMAVSLTAGDALSRRLSRETAQALVAGRQLDARQRATLVGISRRAAIISLGGWSGAALLFGAYDTLRFNDDPDGVARLALTILLGGLTTSALVFLLNEGPLRPVYAIAFRDDPPERTEGLGVRLRLIFSWVLGAGVPFLGVALAFLGVGASDYDSLRPAVLTLVAAGLLAGALITLRAARSVAEPLEALRGALGHVRRGELDVQVAVDDVTEIGLLQAGFNEMVGGLKERARLEDLFGRHVGVEVAREALRRGVRLGGEQREVSALFVDLVGSTELAATRPPDEVVEILNAIFEAVVRTASREGGWVNKFEGDAALCVFGAPLDQPDHATRALRAARALRAELRHLSAEYPGLDAGIGVSSGDAVAGNVGAEQRYEYTVIGDPVNEAARLCDLAKAEPERVLASEASLSGADAQESGNWQLGELVALRGRPERTRLATVSR
jgi:adenylate cyclase